MAVQLVGLVGLCKESRRILAIMKFFSSAPLAIIGLLWIWPALDEEPGPFWWLVIINLIIGGCVLRFRGDIKKRQIQAATLAERQAQFVPNDNGESIMVVLSTETLSQNNNLPNQNQ